MANHLFRKSILSSAVAIALMGGAAPSFAAGSVLFDADGTGGGGNIDAKDFNWIQNSVLVQGGAFNGTKTATQTNTSAVMYGQGLLTTVDTVGGGSASGAGLSGAFTYVFGVDVTAQRKFGNIQDSKLALSNDVAYPGSPTATNYFQIWSNSPTATDLSTGSATFGTGTLILEGVVSLDDNASNPSGTTATDQSSGFSINSSAKATTPVDIAQPSNGGATKQGTNPILTFSTGGTIHIDVKVTSFNSNYFRSTIDAVVFDLNLASAAYSTPFQADANQTFVPGNIAGQSINFGDGTSPVNDFSCAVDTLCDYISGTSQNKTGIIVNDTHAPEPGTLAMLGLGLAGLGALSRRKRA